MKETRICSACGKEHPANELFEFEGKLYCADCLALETIVCEYCGQRINREDNAGNDSVHLCDNCFENRYTVCEECGRIILNEYASYISGSDDPLCNDCYHRLRDSSPIHDYFYKPEPVFYGEDNRFFGVELEVDDAGELDCNAESAMEIANTKGREHIYCKHDGSLDDGFEIVTHPMTLQYHQNEMPWDELLSKLRDMRYLSHQAGSCGLHVHVNRDTFGETVSEQDACIARVLYFVEKHWEELLKFSRRTNRQLDRWAARYGYKDYPKEILDRAKCGGSNGRYSCVNLENRNTIEFRMFRGTLKLNTLIATLQLVNRICDVAYALSDDEIKSMSWTTFVLGCTEPELIQYLKERRIYINEPIDSEEDI